MAVTILKVLGPAFRFGCRSGELGLSRSTLAGVGFGGVPAAVGGSDARNLTRDYGAQEPQRAHFSARRILDDFGRFICILATPVL